MILDDFFKFVAAVIGIGIAIGLVVGAAIGIFIVVPTLGMGLLGFYLVKTKQPLV